MCQSHKPRRCCYKVHGREHPTSASSTASSMLRFGTSAGSVVMAADVAMFSRRHAWRAQPSGRGLTGAAVLRNRGVRENRILKACACDVAQMDLRMHQHLAADRAPGMNLDGRLFRKILRTAVSLYSCIRHECSDLLQPLKTAHSILRPAPDTENSETAASNVSQTNQESLKGASNCSICACA